MATLFIFSGLPGTGKTTLARQLAQQLNAIYLRIDTIEQALRDLCQVQVEGEGYRLAYRISADNLRNGMDVVADSCNPLELTRREWEQVASECGSTYINIEVKCSDQAEHRSRIESRIPGIAGLKVPTWKEVVNRKYHEWTKDRIIIDTADRSETDCMEGLLLAIETKRK
jgi:predicted kinase